MRNGSRKSSDTLRQIQLVLLSLTLIMTEDTVRSVVVKDEV